MTAIQPLCDEGLARSAPDAPQCTRATAWAVLTVTILGSAMTFIDGSVVNIVLPVLREALSATAAETQWIVEAYMLFLTSLLLVGGALGDRWGRRRVFVLGTLLFALASAACGAAGSGWQLIVARGVQGIGAALLVPGSLALISANFSRQHRGRAIGTWASCTSIAAGVGPILGAWLAETLSWRWIFFINMFLYAGLGMTMFVLPSNLIEVRGYSLVQASAALLPFVAVMFGLSRWAGGLMDRHGPRLPLTLGPSISALGFWLFTRGSDPGYWSGVLPAVLVMSLGMGLTVAPLTATVMASAGEGAAGLASGINNAVSRLAALLAVAAVGILVDGTFGPGLGRVAWLATALAALGAASAAILIRSDQRSGRTNTARARNASAS